MQLNHVGSLTLVTSLSVTINTLCFSSLNYQSQTAVGDDADEVTQLSFKSRVEQTSS